jgi:hypothetical protein
MQLPGVWIRYNTPYAHVSGAISERDNWWIEYSWPVVAAIFGGVLGALIWERYKDSDLAVRRSTASTQRKIRKLEDNLTAFEEDTKEINRFLCRISLYVVFSLMNVMVAISLMSIGAISSLLRCVRKEDCIIFSKEWPILFCMAINVGYFTWYVRK